MIPNNLTHQDENWKISVDNGFYQVEVIIQDMQNSFVASGLAHLSVVFVVPLIFRFPPYSFVLCVVPLMF